MKARTLTCATLACGLASLGACGSAQGRHGPALASAAASAAAPTASTAPCGAATATTLVRTVGMVAARIYANELASSEVTSDRRQVEGFAPLTEALAAGDGAAANAAVTSLVYSHTHIVRLRVTHGGSVIADVGGPYILAPVGGSLRARGHTVGRYVLSVQDDSGYVKLVKRFIGVPLVLRLGSRALPVEGATYPGPASLPASGSVSYHGATYEVFGLNATAFPSGVLRISLLISVPASLARLPCAEIRANELGDVARHISRRFSLTPANLGAYIHATAPLTGGLIYVRTTGANVRRLAGSTRPGPSRLPARGIVRYRGQTYRVFSFTAPSSAGALRISQLVRE